MASTNKTKNYKLNQWLGSDYMKRDDLNNDNELIDAALKYNADSLSAEAAARAAGDNAIRDLVSSEAASRQAADEELNSIIKSGVTMSPSIGLGMNSVIRKTDGITVIPKFEIKGKSYTNLLGKDGNCEDTSKWYSYQASLALDSTNKVFGANGIKITLTSAAGNMNRSFSSISSFDLTKYYFICAYAKNGNTVSGVTFYKDSTGGGTVVSGGTITDATKFNLMGFVCRPSDLNASNTLVVAMNGTSGQYAYIDGIMIVPITSAEYALGVSSMMDKYPYVDSCACLQNPYIEVRHDNLVRNGNCEEGMGWWAPFNASAGSLSIENGKFKFVTTADNNIANIVNVKPNTNYYFSANKFGTLSEIQVVNMAETVALSTGGMFNTGANTQVKVRMAQNGATTCYYDSFMLIEGTTAPVSYKPCRIERCVIEGKFTSDDTVTYENGKVSGLLNWKHRTLYGKDYDWKYSGDFTGYKRIFTTYCPDNYASSYGADRTVRVCAKYDGKLLDVTDSATPDACVAFGSGSAWDGEIYIRIADTDSGWTETINPNEDEIKAFMNGWKALGNDGVARYVLWGSVLNNDYHVNINAFPPYTATTLASATIGTKSFTVADSSIFKIGDTIAVFGNSGVIITAISGNVLTVDQNQAAQPVGRTVVRIDFAPTDKRVLNYCKSNIALGYDGYQLNYKLADPEPITDENVHVHGDIPKLDNGDNYLYLDSGIVLGEVANPALNGGYYRINSNYGFGGSTTWLKSSAETINTIYRNRNKDGKWTNIAAPTPSESNGKISAYIADSSYDTNATYTVDYQILKTMNTTPTAITMQYQQDVLSVVSDLAEAVNGRQKADSALDGLVDLSVHEKLEYFSFGGTWMQYSASDYRIRTTVYCISKKAVPIIAIKQNAGVTAFAQYYDGNGNGIDIPSSDLIIAVSFRVPNQLLIRVSYVGTNATIRTNLKTYGGHFACDIYFDCRGRL